METRFIGRNGLPVSAIGLGCMGMSEFYGETNDEQSLETLNHALDQGITLFDSADTYGLGHNEELLGRFLKGKANRPKVATKCGIFRSREMGYSRRIDNTPDYINSCCDASLERLGVDVIDLYYIHRVSADTPIEESVGALSALVKAGKIRHIGLCEVSAATLRRAHAVHPIAAVQSEYSLWSRDPEESVLAACRALGTSFVAYSPLGRGFLTGAIQNTENLAENDFRRHAPRFQGENLEANLKRLEFVKNLADAHHCAPSQIALAWLLAQGSDIIPIPGTRRKSRIDENAGAASVVLTADDLTQLDQAFPFGAAAGPRYTAEGMKGINA
ncbi:pyridoxine 4-dehydrogenase [Azospirillaceae bacterium]